MAIKTRKVRLDSLIVEKGMIESREKARALILAGMVVVNGKKGLKAGLKIDSFSIIEILQRMPFVSRGGLKLDGALKSFKLDVKDKIAMDVGASTGGFTDCLLKYGCSKVYAIDVGYGQMDMKLRNDPRVVLLEKTNIRYLGKKIRSLEAEINGQVGIDLPAGRQVRNEFVPNSYLRSGIGDKRIEIGNHGFKELVKGEIDIATIDVSFISLLKVIPEVVKFLKNSSIIVALIKPQFEVARKDVGKGGVVRSEEKRKEAIHKIKTEVINMGLTVEGLDTSTIKGPKGNVEYFMYLKHCKSE